MEFGRALNLLLEIQIYAFKASPRRHQVGTLGTAHNLQGGWYQRDMVSFPKNHLTQPRKCTVMYLHNLSLSKNFSHHPTFSSVPTPLKINNSPIEILTFFETCGAMILV